MKKNNIRIIVFLIVFFHTILYASPVRIMPLGDSLTYDDAYRDYEEFGGSPRPADQRHAYRNYLWYALQKDHFQIDFVGSKNAGSAITPSFDPDNEGYPGETTRYIAEYVYSFLQANQTDIILLHIGTNDHAEYVGYVEDILDEIDRYETNYHHHIKVVLAKILQRRDYRDVIHQFNINLQSLVNDRPDDDIVMVDMEDDAGLTYDDFQDRTHPSDISGYTKMAKVWYDTLKDILPDYATDDYAWLVPVYHIILN